jgi:hypothetical protein
MPYTLLCRRLRGPPISASNLKVVKKLTASSHHEVHPPRVPDLLPYEGARTTLTRGAVTIAIVCAALPALLRIMVRLEE